MMIKDRVGQKFGRLLVVRDSGERDRLQGTVFWECLCDCGNTVNVRGTSLGNGNTRSCGCLTKERGRIWLSEIGKRNRKHGDARNEHTTRLYRIWAHMKYRCYGSNGKKYKYYGGRNIRVCDEWKNDYAVFKAWALVNGYQDYLTIDRIDNEGHYEPSNCQWLTKSENTRKGNLEYQKYSGGK